jgi:hypothetical protein
MSMFSSSENGKSSVRAKSFPVPSGRIPIRGRCLAPAIPFAISFNVPSPPAATMYSQPARTDWRLHFSASPDFLVINTAVGRKRFSAARVRPAFVTDPAVGLKMIYGFTLRQRISNRLSMFECVAQHSAFRSRNFQQVWVHNLYAGTN